MALKRCGVLALVMGLSGAAAAEGPDLGAMLPRLKPMTPGESMRAMRVEPGFKVELVAAEPEVTEPADLAWDEQGGMYVCELWNYPGVPKAGEPLGRVRLLEDGDGDGYYEKSTLFVEELMWPSGVACWDGGVFVISSPDIWYFKDTNGDGKADVKRKVFTGFKGKTYEVPNTLRWGLDNKIYGASSYAGGRVTVVNNPEAAAVDRGRRRDFRFDPRTEVIEAVVGSGEFGNTFDDWGNRFVCHATNLMIHPVLPLEAIARNPHYAAARVQEDCFTQGNGIFSISKPEPWRVVRKRFWSRWVDKEQGMHASRFPAAELAERGFVTAASGVTVYRGSAYPEEYRGDAFVGEPANNVVVRMKLAYDGPSVKAGRPNPGERREFLASSDVWFRPVNMANGPDGCLYVCDLYREVIEDDSAIPRDIRKHLDLYSGRDKGRIYRIVPEGYKRPARPSLGKATAEELARLLDHGDSWVRETAQRLLVQRPQMGVGKALLNALTRAKTPQGKIHGYWTLRGLGGEGDGGLATLAMAESDPAVRVQGLRLAAAGQLKSPEMLKSLVKEAGDADARVRFEAALALGAAKVGQVSASHDALVVGALADIARKDLGRPWTRVAVLLTAVEGRAGDLMEKLVTDPKHEPSGETDELFGEFAQVAGARNERVEVLQVLLIVTDRPQLGRGCRWGIVRELARGLGRAGTTLEETFNLQGDEARALYGKFKELVREVEAVALDGTKGAAERVEAIGVLGFVPGYLVEETLGKLLEPGQAREVQVAGVRALGAQERPGVGRALVGRWRRLGPGARAEALDVIVKRAGHVGVLLEALEGGKIGAGEIDPARRAALLRHADGGLRERAKKVFGQHSADRQAVIDRYRAGVVKLEGDAKRGEVVFGQTCAMCHRPEKGAAVGPDLGGLADRSPDALLINILDPNREMKADYVNYLLVTKDGEDFSGAIVAETAGGVTVRRAGGLEDTVPRGRIKSLSSTGLSMMPEGLESGVSEQQMADLIRYVQGLEGAKAK